MSDETKKAALLEALEEVTKVSLKQVLAIAKVYAADSASMVDDTVVNSVQLLHDAVLADLVEKINPAD